MVFSPINPNKMVAKIFPQLSVGDKLIESFSSFKYLGHVITNNLTDDDDIQREIRNMFMHTNILLRKFHNCSISVKRVLFKTYCLYLYDVALWAHYTVSQKNDTDVAHHNFNGHQPIFVIFGRDVADRVCYQMMICYPASPN